MDILTSGLALIGLIGVIVLGYHIFKYNKDSAEFTYQYEINNKDGIVKIIFENIDNPNDPFVYEGMYDKWYHKGVSIIDAEVNENLNILMDQILKLEEGLVDKGEIYE